MVSSALRFVVRIHAKSYTNSFLVIELDVKSYSVLLGAGWGALSFQPQDEQLGHPGGAWRAAAPPHREEKKPAEVNHASVRDTFWTP